MRANLVSSDLVECVIGIGKNLFYNSPMEACIMICRTNKSIERRGKVLFINAKNEVTRRSANSFLENSHIEKIAGVYHRFEELDGFSAIATIPEIIKKKNKLSIALYVQDTSFSRDDSSINYNYDSLLSASSVMWEEYDLLNNMVKED